jgi:hypothetical protein
MAPIPGPMSPLVSAFAISGRVMVVSYSAIVSTLPYATHVAPVHFTQQPCNDVSVVMCVPSAF